MQNFTKRSKHRQSRTSRIFTGLQTHAYNLYSYAALSRHKYFGHMAWHTGCTSHIIWPKHWRYFCHVGIKAMKIFTWQLTIMFTSRCCARRAWPSPRRTLSHVTYLRKMYSRKLTKRDHLIAMEWTSTADRLCTASASIYRPRGEIR